jgi:integrase
MISAPPTLHQLFARCEGAYSEITLRGYRSDLERFIFWCEFRGFNWLPAPPEAVASFIDIEAREKSIATVKRRIAAIQFAHCMADLSSPVRHSAVRLALRRAGRTKLRRPKQVRGLTVDLLDRILSACPHDLQGLRDSALLSVGYDTLCRSSELAAIQVSEVDLGRGLIRVRRSKADQFGDGRIAYLAPRTIELVRRWIDAAGLSNGPLFRGLHTGAVSGGPLDTSSIRRIVKRAANRAELGSEIALTLSGHSMRVGAAQDMMVAGVDTLGIMHAGGWRTYSVLARYVEKAAGERMHAQRWSRMRVRCASSEPVEQSSER